MNALLKLYFRLPHDKTFGILSKIFNRVVAKIIKRILDATVPAYFLRTQHKFPTGLNKESRPETLTVSLTSFPGRIADVWIAIECLFRQTYKADKIVLWLSREQFNNQNLPKNLLSQEARGLEIRFVDEDLKSHKKYIYSYYPEMSGYLVTVDDDLYYDEGLLQNVVDIKKRYPEHIATNRAHQINFSEDGAILPYSKWSHNIISNTASYLNVQTGGFGTLYELNDLADTYNNPTLINNLTPHADDLWLKVQTLLRDKAVITNSRYNKDPITILNSQLEKLVNFNVHNGGNDVQLRNALAFFNLGNLEKFRKVKIK